MQKIILILVSVLSLASAVIGYLNRDHFLTERGLKEAALEELASTKRTLATTQEELRKANEKIDELNADIKKKDETISSLTVNLDKVKADLEDSQKKVADQDAKLTQQTSDLAAKDTRIADLESKLNDATAGTSQVDDLKKQLVEKDILTASLQTKIKEIEGEVSTLRQYEADRKAKMMRKGLEGTILAVNPSWNFVIISLGDRNGIVENSELLIKRGNQLIGKLRITSVEPSTSVADIVVNSVRTGLSIQPGDTVIYNGPESEADIKQ
jgi:peptidoglycan hydrolase CwlO-like protein